MIEEPDIIKELREEERIGKLYKNQFNFKNRLFNAIGFKTDDNLNNNSDIKINSYKDALDLAKKALNDINK